MKSRSLKSSDFETATSGRDEAQASISIKKEDLDLLVSTKHSFLVIVVFIQDDARRFEDRAIHFWFGSAHIKTLLDRGYFLPDQADRRVCNLICSLRMLPMLSVKELLETLVSQNHLTEEEKRMLASEFPERVPRNSNASEYVAVARGARNDPNDLVWRQVPDEFLDLQNMGFDVGLGHLD